MDLKKLFVYVPAESEATFTASVINVPAEAAKYANKIVFLESSHRIWVKEKFYGTDPQNLEAIYTLIGGKTIEDLRTKLDVNSGADFAEAIKVALDALDKAIKAEVTARKAVTGISGDVYAAPAGTTYLGESTSLQNADFKLDAAIAAEVNRATAYEAGIVTSYEKADAAIIAGYQNAIAGLDVNEFALTEDNSDVISIYGIKEDDGKIAKGTSKIDLAKVAKTGAAADVTFAPGKSDLTSTNANAAIVEVKGSLDTEVTRATNREKAIEAKLPAVNVEGSGLSVRVDTEESTGKKTYVVIADQSIWEFMGSATAASVAAIPATLDGKYSDEGAKRDHAEVGDVWAVTVGSNTTLYACSKLKSDAEEYNTWTLIGSAQGISGVDTTPSHGVNLTNTASVVGLEVTPGTIEQNNSYVVTGGAVWSAIDTAYTKLYSYTTNEIATEAAAREQAYTDAKAYTDEKVAAEHDLAYAYANSRANEAQANVYAKIEALDANITGDEKYGTYAYVSYSLTQEDGKVTGANVSVNLSVIENYVVDNLWEEYRA